MVDGPTGDAPGTEPAPVAVTAEARGRRANILSATPSPVGVLLAGLQAAKKSRDSPNASESETRGRRSRPSSTSTAKASPPDSPASKQASFDKLSDGILVDAHQLVRDASVTLDVFKGSLVVLMVTSNTIITMSTIHLRSRSFGSLFICNAAASMCFVGFLMAFGFSCYGQYLLEWPDPLNESELSSLRLRVLRTIAFPVVGAWACNFAWCFLCLKNSFSGANLFDVFTFSRVFGNGPDFLCSFSLDLAIVYLLWRSINRFLKAAEHVEDGSRSVAFRNMASSLSPQSRRDLAALVLALCPLLTTLVAVPDCTGNWRFLQWFLVCDKRDIDTPSLPAIPHLTNFGFGILAAACWNRFLADLRPLGNGGPGGGASVLSTRALRSWFSGMLATLLVSLLFFLPLGQVWLYADLSVVQMATPLGQLVRGFSNGPSMLWLLATIWPIAMWAALIVVLVTLRGTVLGWALQWPLGWLEHLGANVLFYLVIADLILAGMFRGFSHNPSAFDFPTCLTCSMLIFAFGGFIHGMSKASRK